MILTAFTAFHVILSLIGIVAGFAVAYGMLSSRRMDGWTGLFLWTTVATSVTGFLFPVHKFMPSHGVGILSLILLTIAIVARNRFHLEGGWRRTYVITALLSLYFNVFVLIVQMFEKVPALKELAPTYCGALETTPGAVVLAACVTAPARWKLKALMSCATPFSRRVKSSFFRSRTGCPFSSVATTSTTTTRVVTRMTLCDW